MCIRDRDNNPGKFSASPEHPTKYKTVSLPDNPQNIFLPAELYKSCSGPFLSRPLRSSRSPKVSIKTSLLLWNIRRQNKKLQLKEIYVWYKTLSNPPAEWNEYFPPISILNVKAHYPVRKSCLLYTSRHWQYSHPDEKSRYNRHQTLQNGHSDG